MIRKNHTQLHGECHPQFAAAGKTLLNQLPKSGPGGAALCVYHKGHKVVDIWAGSRNEQGDPWQHDTLSLSFSTTKGIASTLLHILASQGKVDYNQPVAHYWPEFGQAGKADITVRQVLCHEAGLYDIHNMLEDAALMTDWEAMTAILAARAPAHLPGTANGYHALTYGWLIGEIIQRATGQSFDALLHTHLIEPLSLDGLFIGLPASEFHRRARLIDHRPAKPATDTATRRRTPLINRAQQQAQKKLIEGGIRLIGNDPADIRNGLMPKGIGRFDFNSDHVVSACIPAANGMFTARSLATVYAMMASQGRWQKHTFIEPRTFRKLSTVHSRRLDKVLPIRMNWRLGYHRVFTTGPKTPHAFGHFGFGGSGAWCDPSRELAVALTLNSGVGTPLGDTRIARINSQVIRCAQAGR